MNNIRDIIFGIVYFIKVRLSEKNIVADKPFFNAHYRLTTTLLAGFTIILTWKQYSGDRIICMANASHQIKAINTFCWATSTYALPYIKNENLGNPDITTEKKYYQYYQWVPLFLFLQSLLFYGPHWLWKFWENEKIKRLTHEIRGNDVDPVLVSDKLVIISSYITQTWHSNQIYALKYHFCELLNIVNVLINIYILNWFLDNAFFTYGLKVISFHLTDDEIRNDPMIKTFPRLTKCDFRKIGPSGTIMNVDAFCLLPLNLYIEKIYIIIWFWLLALLGISILALLHSIAEYFKSSFRAYNLKNNMGSTHPEVHHIVRRSKFGDYLLLYFMKRNLNPVVFNSFIRILRDELRETELRY